MIIAAAMQIANVIQIVVITTVAIVIVVTGTVVVTTIAFVIENVRVTKIVVIATT